MIRFILDHDPSVRLDIGLGDRHDTSQGFARHAQMTILTTHPTLNLKTRTSFDLGQSDPHIVILQSYWDLFSRGARSYKLPWHNALRFLDSDFELWRRAGKGERGSGGVGHMHPISPKRSRPTICARAHSQCFRGLWPSASIFEQYLTGSESLPIRPRTLQWSEVIGMFFPAFREYRAQLIPHKLLAK